MVRIAIQLLTPRQDREALRLLAFPGEPLLPPGGSISVELWQAGQAKRFRAKSPEELRQRIAAEPCNEARIARSPAVSQVLDVSPTSSLWAPTGDSPAPTRKGESLRLSHGSRDKALRWNGIGQCPTLLETFVELEESPGISGLCRLLRDSVPAELREEPLTGGADLLTEAGVFLDVLESLAPWPRGIPMLAERFDDLHAILAGPRSRCEELAEALGAGEVHACGESPSSLAFLGLGDVAREPAAKEKARPWLVPRDESTRHQDLDAGGVRFAGHLYLTARRREELRRQGMIPAPPEGWAEWPVVETKYLDLLGIDPGEMLTGLSSADLVLRAREEIDRKYLELSGVEPPAKRVWTAHRDVYESRGFGLFGRASSDLLNWVEERYFSPSYVRNEG